MCFSIEDSYIHTIHLKSHKLMKNKNMVYDACVYFFLYVYKKVSYRQIVLPEPDKA